MAFRVEVTPPAKRDAKEILKWLDSQQAGEAGLRWFRKLEEAIASLSNLPGRCTLAPENALSTAFGRVPGWHRLPWIRLLERNHCRIPAANTYRDLPAVERDALFAPDIFSRFEVSCTRGKSDLDLAGAPGRVSHP